MPADRIPSPEQLREISAAASQFLLLAREGLPGRTSMPVTGLRMAAQAGARLETALNPARLPLDAPDLVHRALEVRGWNPEVSLGLTNLRAAYHDFMARWRWDCLAIGEDPEQLLQPLVIPYDARSDTELDLMARALELVRKGMEEADRESTAPRAGADPRREAERRTEATALDRTIELAGSSPRAVQLIRYLAAREGQKAHLDQIAIDLYKARTATARKRRNTTRQGFNRARDLLEKEGAPLRLEIANNEVSLVPGTGYAHVTRCDEDVAPNV